jgi:hypothetical protein
MAEPRRRVYRKRTFLDADMGLRETRLFVWHMAGLENFLESQPGNTRAWVADTEVFVRALAHFEVGMLCLDLDVRRSKDLAMLLLLCISGLLWMSLGTPCELGHNLG